ncbi:hypothetical protein QVD17_03636 [Tagetes erecta]|uniref:Uncharacterized protein n=1 Tax=Tagetes erecta TaxID=13708 RepID=A0AAD8PA42_TARER|nr:hypothetical protein QVD17_03636 [Tagetes erecta]
MGGIIVAVLPPIPLICVAFGYDGVSLTVYNKYVSYLIVFFDYLFVHNLRYTLINNYFYDGLCFKLVSSS